MGTILIPFLTIFMLGCAFNVSGENIIRPSGRVTPEAPHLFPKAIGFVQVGDMEDPLDWDGYNFQSNEETANQIVNNGFQAVHLWPHETVQSKDIEKVICNPGIKAIAIRPQARLSWDSGGCREGYSATWENDDFGQIAYDLLKKHGDLACRGGEPLTIILNNWEGDWQAKGPLCTHGVPSEYRLRKVKAMYEMRQLGVEWARNQFPNASLKVIHGVVTNHRVDSKYEWTLTRDLIPYLDPQPDAIGLSFYGDQGDETPQQAVDTIQRHTGYTVDQMYVAEMGKSENWKGRQADWFALWMPQWEATGVRLIFIWTWKQYWSGTLKEDGSRKGDWYGVWEVDEHRDNGVHNNVFCAWTSGLEYLSEFRLSFEEDPLPPVTWPVCK